MSLRKYAEACSGFVSELKAGLTREDVDELRTDLKAMGLRKWGAWYNEHEEIIYAYVGGTPSDRARIDKERGPQIRRRLILSAIKHCLEAQALLRVIDEDGLDSSAGHSYRSMAAQAGLSYWNIVVKEFPYWNLDGESPFLEDRAIRKSMKDR